MNNNFELVCGLETHVELATDTKIFCSCTTKFGGEPNAHCCPVCVGEPGTLPVLNARAVEYAVLAGLALNCEISPVSKMDRKNYFYPDLPKAYQVTQSEQPVCGPGYVELDSGKKIRIHHIHLEEDAGKLVHKGSDILVDCNRGCVPLIEIVTEPDFGSADEVTEYLEKLQMIMRYIGVSDCKMQEGSMRCDVNISVREEGSTALGVRSEIKNMNSFTFIRQAIGYEFERHTDAILSGEKLVQETRRFDAARGITESMRTKEDAAGYRYFRDPDFVPVVVSQEQVSAARESLPELPGAKKERYIGEFEINPKDADNLVKYRRVAEFFEAAIVGVKKAKTAANFILSGIFRTLPTEEDKENFSVKITAKQLNELIKLIEDGQINMNTAKGVLDKMLDSGKSAMQLVDKSQLGGIAEDELAGVCERVVAGFSSAVADYKAGKEAALGAIIGGVMKETRGKADPVKVREILKNMLTN